MKKTRTPEKKSELFYAPVGWPPLAPRCCLVLRCRNYLGASRACAWLLRVAARRGRPVKKRRTPEKKSELFHDLVAWPSEWAGGVNWHFLGVASESLSLLNCAFGGVRLGLPLAW